MAFIPEDGTGLSNSTSYTTVAEFKSYSDTIGFVYSPAYTDPQIQIALNQATQYIEQRFRYAFLGQRLCVGQGLSWPRLYVADPYQPCCWDCFIDSDIVPTNVKNATSILAQKALLGGPLFSFFVDPEYDETGQTLIALDQQVGPIRESKKYQQGGARSVIKRFPGAEALLLDFIGVSSGTIRN